MPAGILYASPLTGETDAGAPAGRRPPGCRRPSPRCSFSVPKGVGHRPRHEGGGALRRDAEVLLNTAGRRALMRLGSTEEEVPGRALPS